MKHLVLGSEGQIGKYVCDEIERNGDEVIRWDITLNPLHDLRAFAHALPTKGTLLIETMKECDFVHFLAFDVGGSTYLAKNQNSYEYIRNNVLIMENVFSHLKVSSKPFYFASSQMSNMTDSVYGQLKAIGESYTKALGGLNLRFWNVYGYESDPEKTHVITDFIKMALRDGRILCKTDGEEGRNWTHAEDAARMLYGTSKNYEKLSTPSIHTGLWSSIEPGFYPLAARPNFNYSIKRIAETIAKLMGDIAVYYSDKPDTTQTITNEIDFDHLFYFQQAIGFDSRDVYGIEAGIKDMIDRIKADDVR